MKVIQDETEKSLNVGQPIYTKSIMELANIYIKNRRVLKNRWNKPFDYDREIRECNHIVIEDDGYVNIFCPKEREGDYIAAIEKLKRTFGDLIENKIIINSK